MLSNRPLCVVRVASSTDSHAGGALLVAQAVAILAHGETAILKDTPRNADVVAAHDEGTVVLELTRDDFVKLLGQGPPRPVSNLESRGRSRASLSRPLCESSRSRRPAFLGPCRTSSTPRPTGGIGT